MGILEEVVKTITKPLTDIVGKAVVDKDKVREIQLEVKKIEDLARQRDHELLTGQMEINKEEAKHDSIFVAGWRPSIGWVSSAGLFMYYPVQMAIQLWNDGVITMDTTDLFVLLGGMLGFGTLRTFERAKGVARKNFKDTEPKWNDGLY